MENIGLLCYNESRVQIKKNTHCAWRKKKNTGLSVIKCESNEVMTKRFYVTQMFTTDVVVGPLDLDL